MRATLGTLILAALVCAGCTTVDPQERRARDEASCRDYGFRPGTDAFAECLQRIDLSREADARARDWELRALSRPVYSPIILR
ncbi:hypothetical protein [Aureimonas populi]|uniref:Lipoprotein n=1 Tax=Aureimonas populi TaxID=1701758 RepID=A0ABW5CH66_9HYPH|nr:hypothetical protein [Aureimonas populi]